MGWTLADSIASDYGGIDSIGPNSDGTYGIPVAAQPTNDPSNTAGFPSLTSQGALDFLKYGVSAISDTWKFSSMLDYKRFEATNGGLFQQGRTAGYSPTQARASGSGTLAILLLLGFFVFTKKA